MKKLYKICLLILLMTSSTLVAQQVKQQRADRLFTTFSFVDAIEVYKDLVEKDYNADYAKEELLTATFY